MYISAGSPTPGVQGGPGNVPIPQVIIDDLGYKLAIGIMPEYYFTGPLYPNASSIWQESDRRYVIACGTTNANTLVPVYNPTTGSYAGACLFNVFSDPGELNNIAATNIEIVQRLSARLFALNKTVFNPDRGDLTDIACDVSVSSWGGALGPWVILDTPFVNFSSSATPSCSPSSSSGTETLSTSNYIGLIASVFIALIVGIVGTYLIMSASRGSHTALPTNKVYQPDESPSLTVQSNSPPEITSS